MTTRTPGPPWPLYPKLVCVALLLGGFVCALVLVLATPREDIEDWQHLIDAVGTLFKLVIVPASFATVVFSALLLWRARSRFFRRRWAKAKLAWLALTLPALHVLARGVFTAIRRELAQGSLERAGDLLSSFTWLVVVSIVVLLVALWLARYRPRLGQPP